MAHVDLLVELFAMIVNGRPFSVKFYDTKCQLQTTDTATI